MVENHYRGRDDSYIMIISNGFDISENNSPRGPLQICLDVAITYAVF